MTKVYIYPYNALSESAKALAEAMGAKRIKTEGSGFREGPGKTVINYGSSACPYTARIVNFPGIVRVFAYKTTTFEALYSGCRMPDWTTDRSKALTWQREGLSVMARLVNNGHSGNGIVYCGGGDEIPPAHMYTKYVKKAAEYRIHFVRGKPGTYTSFIQRKAKVQGHENPNWKVRNLAGGFIYANDAANVGEVPEDVTTQAYNAFISSALDFGAVDVLWNKKQKKAYVLEINTAPGLQGRTLEFYSTALKELVG